jgi:sodium transport system permease protein
MAAAGLGLVIGYIAVQTGSLVPCILFHMTYNAVMFSMAELATLYQSRPGLSGLVTQSSGEVLYIWPVTAICAVAAAVLLWWLHRLPYQATREEEISEARALQGQHPLASGLPGNVE